MATHESYEEPSSERYGLGNPHIVLVLEPGSLLNDRREVLPGLRRGVRRQRQQSYYDRYGRHLEFFVEWANGGDQGSPEKDLSLCCAEISSFLASVKTDFDADYERYVSHGRPQRPARRGRRRARWDSKWGLMFVRGGRLSIRLALFKKFYDAFLAIENYPYTEQVKNGLWLGGGGYLGKLWEDADLQDQLASLGIPRSAEIIPNIPGFTLKQSTEPEGPGPATPDPESPEASDSETSDPESPAAA
ncbi:hypothetical protein BJ508DRAFT_335618 [Ascobolus immersus RN42]|uniref:Uncharacterized protein n=1 Tax=Ascobolus immersus RN42 TaxID=1160509 RepID=A0A3N4HHT9_ASCIM|nr:hypothetical protein BJ508DRAFT_335618 [Ascobolus immersus RN42]